MLSSQQEDSKESSKNKIILKNNNLLNNEFSDDLNENRIDISIQFSNAPISINCNNNQNTTLKKIKPKTGISSSNKKKNNKTMADSLYKDLKEIHNNLENRNDYFKKHHYNIDYQKHYGDEKTCPICKEVRKKGKIMEKEKGLFSAFNFRNYKTIRRKSLNKLKLSRIKKNQTAQKLDLLSDEERKKNNIYSWNNLNNLSQQNLEFKKKYMQFNGMNRLQRYKRYGSIDNYMNYRNSNNSRNDNYNVLNDGRLFEKNDDIFNNSEYPVLRNYFHDNDENNNYKLNNNYFG